MSTSLPANGVSRLGGNPGAARSPRSVARTLGHPLVRVVARRLLMAALLLFVVSALSFVLASLTPGDAARQILGTQAPPSAYVELRRALGLDLPLYEQYWQWVSHAVQGDLGTSIFSSQPVGHVLAQRLPVTLSLMLGALVVSVLLGTGIGIFSAVRGGAAGRAVDALALLGFAVPSFWLGALLISWFAVKLRWFPATGYVDFATSPAQWLQSLVLPVGALALGSVAAIAKQTREAMQDALGSEYVRMAWANGVSAPSIFFRHALKNAGVRVLTVTGVQVVGLLGGAVVVESVFALPGLGSLAVNATVQHDLPLVQGIVIYFTAIVVAINICIDVAYSWLNPKVRVA